MFSVAKETIKEGALQSWTLLMSCDHSKQDDIFLPFLQDRARQVIVSRSGTVSWFELLHLFEGRLRHGALMDLKFCFLGLNFD